MSLKLATPGTSTHGGDVKSGAVTSILLVDIDTTWGRPFVAANTRGRQLVWVLDNKGSSLNKIWGIWFGGGGDDAGYISTAEYSWV